MSVSYAEWPPTIETVEALDELLSRPTPEVEPAHPHARYVVFSSGNVYPLAPVLQGGSTEGMPPAPVGEYAQSVLGRERVFQYWAERQHTLGVLFRLNYAVEMRYGVLLDVAHKVWAGQPIDLSMGHANIIWQGDANAYALRALSLATDPPLILNVTGPETVSIRSLALQFGALLGVEPALVGQEQPEALLSSAQRALSYAFWRHFAEIESVVAIKIAPFNRYQTLAVIRAVTDAGRAGEIALYTGNDDHIVEDLAILYRVGPADRPATVRIVGGLLGHWAVWTRGAVNLLQRCRAARGKEAVPTDLLSIGLQVTDCNAVLFDVAHEYAGCIAGIHDVLRRQGLFAACGVSIRKRAFRRGRKTRSIACTRPILV
jgi:hypothetical protein